MTSADHSRTEPSSSQRLSTDHSLSRSERLKSRRLIGLLFSEGSSLKNFPIRLVWRKGKLLHAVPVQVAFSVGKSNFKRAPNRNRIKRLLREAYRLNKAPLHEILEQQQEQLSLMFVYTGKKMPAYTAIEAALVNILTNLVEELEQTAKDELGTN